MYGPLQTQSVKSWRRSKHPLNVLVDIVFESIEIHPKIIEIAEGCVFLLLIQFRSMFLLMDTDSLSFGGDIIDKMVRV